MSLRCHLTCCCLAALVAVASLNSVVYAQVATAVPAPLQFRLKKLLIAETEKKTLEMLQTTDPRPIVIEGLDVLKTKDFDKALAPFFGQPITDQSLENMRTSIVKYLNDHDRPSVRSNVIFLAQNLGDITNGTYRLIVTLNRYSQLQIKGNRYFSRQLLEAQLGIKPGDEVRLSTLEQGVNWTNANPFDRVQVLINTVNKKPGDADLDITVQETLPVRVSGTYDDSGSPGIGVNHYTGAIQLGNLWGLGHQLTYQYTTTDVSHLYEAQGLDYKYPLPWHAFIQFDAAYAVFRPTFEEGLFGEVGKNVIMDLRYDHTVQKGQWTLDMLGGLDFKQINNNLQYGGQQVFNRDSNIFQVTQSATLIHRGTTTSWSLGANLNESPGNINTKNTQSNLASTRQGARSRYIYGDLFLQSLTQLPTGFQFFARAQAQESSTNLLGSEQLSIGGQNTVRGYNPSVSTGDNGWLYTNELQGPLWNTRLPFEKTTYPPLQTRLLVFFDAGRVYYHKVGTAPVFLNELESTGVGLRSNLATNFSLTLDYGWQLRKSLPPQPNTGHGDIRATLAY